LGVQKYLKKYSFKSATALDLWQEFQSISEEPILEIMGKWMSQPGFPKLAVKVLSWDEKKLKIEISYGYH
jgi:aminopeptidase N